MHNHSNEHQDSLRNRDKQQLGNGPLSESPHTTDVEVGEKSEETNFLTLIKVAGLLNNLHFSLDIERLSYDLAKINVKTERKQECKTLNCLIEKKNKRARIFIALANADANNVISPWNFLESFALTSVEMQYCDWVIELITGHI